MSGAATYGRIHGNLHRHGRRPHSHPHSGPHEHHHHGHSHSHGLVDDSIKRSREGLRAVVVSLAILGAGAGAQLAVFLASSSLALLADLIHNFGDALTAIPLGAAFLLRSERAESWAGTAVVAVIFASAAIVGIEAVDRLVHPAAPDHLGALAMAGAIGFVSNRLAGRLRTRTGRRIDSPALLADGDHARADAYVSLGVVASAAACAVGAPILDPVIGLAISAVILQITRRSWATVRGTDHRH